MRASLLQDHLPAVLTTCVPHFGLLTLQLCFCGSFIGTCGRRGGLMVSELDSGSSGPGSSPAQGHCVVFLGKTLNSHSASLHPGV